VPSYEEHLINSQDSLQASLRMKKCLEQLSPAQKTVLTLKFYKDLSHDQIAKQLNTTKRTVYNQIYEAIKKMKRLMQD
jgi:RNA polymerase sigma factor (sigma-70 family)